MGIDLTTELTALRDRLLSAEAEHADLISRVRERHRASARNLVHYVALRGTDLRPLQEALSDAGLSSLGRMEAGVLGHVDAVLAAVRALDGEDAPSPDDDALTLLEGGWHARHGFVERNRELVEELGDVDGPVVAMAFGPGLTVESALLTVRG